RGSAQVVSLEAIVLNGGSIAARGDEAVQAALYLGDTNGDGHYSALDASLLARVVIGLDSGFDAYAPLDPRLVADVTGNGRLSALDASYVARKAVGLDQAEIPDLPAPAPVSLVPSISPAAPGEGLDLRAFAMPTALSFVDAALPSDPPAEAAPATVRDSVAEPFVPLEV
ncbi:MAG: dockerin type I repeat-containing protein, partial [Planctomycetales bacterium]|nr:dockerin type I repeat-containing protein [Planctomycetales bacterium]